MKKVIFINMFSLVFYLLTGSHVSGYDHYGKIDDIFTYNNLTYYPPVPGYRSYCYLEGQFTNKSSCIFYDVIIKIYAIDFVDKFLWEKQITFKMIEPNKKYSFSEQIVSCKTPSKFEFALTGLQQVGNRNEEYFSGFMEQKGDLKRVNHIQLTASNEKDKTFSFVISYSNIYWEGWPVSCYCLLYENNGSLSEPVKGSQIAKLVKKIHKSSQTIYMDIPSYYNTFNSRSGILECTVSTGFNVMKANNTLLFSKYKEQLTENNNEQGAINNESESLSNHIQTNAENNIPDKYEIHLISGRTLFANTYQKQDNILHISNNNGKFNINLDNVKEIREIKQSQKENANENRLINTQPDNIIEIIDSKDEDLESERIKINQEHEEFLRNNSQLRSSDIKTK